MLPPPGKAADPAVDRREHCVARLRRRPRGRRAAGVARERGTRRRRHANATGRVEPHRARTGPSAPVRVGTSPPRSRRLRRSHGCRRFARDHPLEVWSVRFTAPGVDRLPRRHETALRQRPSRAACPMPWTNDLDTRSACSRPGRRPGSRSQSTVAPNGKTPKRRVAYAASRRDGSMYDQSLPDVSRTACADCDHGAAPHGSRAGSIRPLCVGNSIARVGAGDLAVLLGTPQMTTAPLANVNPAYIAGVIRAEAAGRREP